MVIYEVNIEVSRDIEAEFLPWLKGHVEQFYKIDGFLGVRVYRRTAATKEQLAVTVHYDIDNLKQLEEYFAQRAERLRQDGVERFGGMFTSNRRILAESIRLPVTKA